MSPTSIFGDLAERERLRNSEQLTVYIDPGSTRYLIDADGPTAEVAFRREFPLVNFEPSGGGLHSYAAGTTLDIILTGVSLGAGLVATEFLKESGKKLWKTIEGLLTKKQSSSDTKPVGGNDTVRIELRIGDSSMTAEISGLGAQSLPLLREFLLQKPHELYSLASETLGDRSSCPSCEHHVASVSAIPCRYCTRNGDKLRLIANEICTLEGQSLRDNFRVANRRRDYYAPTGDA
jgi:hypothetical protein